MQIAHTLPASIPTSILTAATRHIVRAALLTLTVTAPVLSQTSIPPFAEWSANDAALMAAVGDQPAAAQTDSRNQFDNLAPGTRVRLTLRDGASVSGRVVSIDAEAVVLREIKTGPSGVRTPGSASLENGLRFERADVTAVEVLTPVTAPAGSGVATSFDQLRVLVGPGASVERSSSARLRWSP
jgi:hypothetical protein